jgi:HAD superfamily hydrolase (TIGR01490 family)
LARTGVAAFMDLDKTIIAGSSSLAFSRPFLRHGLISRRTALRSAYAQFLLMFSGADADLMEKMRSRLTQLCTGWDVAQVRAVVAETLHDIVEPLVYAEAAALIADHQQRGDEVIVLSASGDEVVRPIAELVGADDCIATRMVVQDGRYTGEIELYCYGQQKADQARAVAEQRGYDLAACSAYSDSITDLPLLEVVGHPVVVNPDRALRKIAMTRGWPVLSFTKPVRLRRQIRPPSAQVVTAVAGLAAAILLGWYGRRRHRGGRAATSMG